MNRGSGLRVEDGVGGLDQPSMRPRFMNRGSTRHPVYRVLLHQPLQ